MGGIDDVGTHTTHSQHQLVRAEECVQSILLRWRAFVPLKSPTHAIFYRIETGPATIRYHQMYTYLVSYRPKLLTNPPSISVLVDTSSVFIMPMPTRTQSTPSYSCSRYRIFTPHNIYTHHTLTTYTNIYYIVFT